MDIKTFISVVSNLPEDISVLAKGPTGIGKSHIFHQIGKEVGLPVIDRRLSQMTEGDIIGLPELVDGVTRFAPVDWLIRACKEPVVLFFDELNRATNEVQQCAFQLVLDRELNGQKLHKETRVFVAVNEGSDYQVTEMDPALLRRFWATDLEPTTDDWLAWAENNDEIDPIVYEYISRFPAHLRHTGEFEPGTVYPNPASWHRLSKSLISASLAPSDNLGENYDSLISSIAKGFVGDSTSITFVDFLKKYKTSFSAEDVINEYGVNVSKTKRIDNLSNDNKNSLLKQVAVFSDSNDFTLEQVEKASKFVMTCSDEMLLNFYGLLQSGKNVDNLKKFNRHLKNKILSAANEVMSEQ